MALLIFLGEGGAAATAGAAECKPVRGILEETLAPEGCLSPVGLCTVAQMSGRLKGQARFTASAFIPSADTAATGVVFVTGDIIIADAKLGSRLGTLALKNGAAFRTVGEGDLSDTQVILGGTGDFIGATGSLRVSGTFVGSSGSASYEGTICLP